MLTKRIVASNQRRERPAMGESERWQVRRSGDADEMLTKRIVASNQRRERPAKARSERWQVRGGGAPRTN
jgi:hypothetical protein